MCDGGVYMTSAFSEDAALADMLAPNSSMWQHSVIADEGIDAMRWLLLMVAFAAFSLAYLAKTSETLGIAILVGVVALVCSFLGFAQARISETARPDAAMLSDKDIALLRNAMRNAKKKPPPRA